MHIAWPLLQEFAHVHVGVLTPRAAADEHIAKGDPLMLPPHRWHRDALHPVDLGSSLLPGVRARTFLTQAVGSHQGIKEGFLAPLHQPKIPGKGSTATCGACARTTMVFVLQETHGKIEFLQASPFLDTQFHKLGTFVNDQVNAGGSAMLIRKRFCMATLCLRMRSHNRAAVIS